MSATWDLYQSKTEEQLATDYFAGADLDHNAWWILHWQWNGSRYWRRQSYWLKREAIKRATDAGLVFLRMVEWRGKCRTCDGSGEYYPWHWEPGDKPASCRRCSGRGWVSLKFIECNVANYFTFHQPYDHTNPFRGDQIDWLQPHPAGTWAPNQPGVRLDAEQVSGLLAFLKRRFWIGQPGYVKEIYTYMGVAI